MVKERLREILARLQGTNIAVIGDFMLDEYVWGQVSRISPEAPVPVVEVIEESFTLGGAGNVVMNAGALGGTVIAFGVVGEDESGRRIREILNKDGVTDSTFVDPTRPTTVKKRVVAHSQHVVRVDKETRSPIGEGFQRKILGSLHAQLPQLDALIVSDYNKGMMSRRLFDEVVRLCHQAGCPVFLDPKVSDLHEAAPIMAITPNDREAEKLSGITITDVDSLERAAGAILAFTGAKHVLITRGKNGMALFTSTDPPVYLPTQARQVYDVTGAGDTVIAALATAVAAGATMTEASQLANLAAGIVVGKVGTATVSRDELVAALDGKWPSGSAREAKERHFQGV